MKRGFQSSVVTPVGITIVVCALITRELLAPDLFFSSFVLNKILCVKAAVTLFQCGNCLTNRRPFSFSFQSKMWINGTGTSRP